MAKALNAAKVPFVFLTGYDQAVIPEAFATVQRLQKPLEPAAPISDPVRSRSKAASRKAWVKP